MYVISFCCFLSDHLCIYLLYCSIRLLHVVRCSPMFSSFSFSFWPYNLFYISSPAGQRGNCGRHHATRPWGIYGYQNFGMSPISEQEDAGKWGGGFSLELGYNSNSLKIMFLFSFKRGGGGVCVWGANTGDTHVPH